METDDECAEPFGEAEGRGQTGDDPGSRQREAVPQHFATDLLGRGANREAHADVTRALAHGVAQHAVDSDGREPERQAGERGHQRQREPARADDCVSIVSSVLRLATG